MSIILASAVFGAAIVVVAIMAVALRLLRGPSAADRAIAIDMLGLLAIVVAALTAVIAGHQGFLDVAFGVALVGFLAAVSFAGLLERIGLTAPPQSRADAGERP